MQICFRLSTLKDKVIDKKKRIKMQGFYSWLVIRNLIEIALLLCLFFFGWLTSSVTLNVNSIIYYYIFATKDWNWNCFTFDLCLHGSIKTKKEKIIEYWISLMSTSLTLSCVWWPYGIFFLFTTLGRKL